MAKPRPEMKAEPAANATTRVLPMKLKVGDHITDETGEGRPRRQAMMLLGRASLVIMLVVMLALLALVNASGEVLSLLDNETGMHSCLEPKTQASPVGAGGKRRHPRAHENTGIGADEPEA